MSRLIRIVPAVVAIALVAAAPARADRLFGVKPQLEGATTLESGHFAYDVPAGTSVHDSAVVINYQPQPLEVSTYLADMTTADGGGEAPAQQNETMRGVGEWATLDDATQTKVTIPANGRVSVPFTLAVPQELAPGDYVGAFVVAARTGEVRNGFAIETRAALTIRLRVVGKLHLALGVGRPTIRRDGKGYAVKVAVRNTGNALTTLDGRVRLSGRAHGELRLGPSHVYVIPHGSTTMTARFTDPPTYGRVRFTPVVRGSVLGGPTKQFRGPSASFKVVPWSQLGGAIGIVLVGTGAGFATRRVRRACRQRRREEKELLRRYRKARRLMKGQTSVALTDVSH